MDFTPRTTARAMLGFAVVFTFVFVASTAFADITGFIGTDISPANRLDKGIAVGAGLAIVAFEFEYSDANSDPSSLAPSLKTGMVNGLLQTPVPLFGIQPYVTAGAGLYHESLLAQTDTGVGINLGLGAKIALVGPFRLRIDYRLFKLAGDAITSPANRVYVGVNFKF